MERVIRYVNSRGDEVSFGATSSPWKYSEADIFNLKQSYRTVGNTITSFMRDTQELGMRIFTNSGSLKERNRIASVLMYDARVRKHGTLYAGGSYLKCYVQDISESDWFYFDEKLTADLTFVTDRPSWVRKETATLVASEPVEPTGLDYPHDYPFDYVYSAGTTDTVNNPFMLPARCDIVFPGPCVNPYVIIGGNRYQVNATAVQGQLIIVRGFEKPYDIVLKSANGDERSIFRYGVREKGAHVFADIPAGNHQASWAGAYNIEIAMYEESPVPFWI